MDFKKKAEEFHNCLRSNCSIHDSFDECEKKLEESFKEVWNEAIKKSVQTLEDGTESGEFYASKIRELKEK